MTAPEYQSRTGNASGTGSCGSTTTAPRQAAGSGLGLAIVREIAVAHGGDALVGDASPGPGAEFVIRLPLLGADTSGTSESEVQPARHLKRIDN